ncbi:MAG: HAMP domain-containing protein [Nanoarchaeota archaeon]|nr:HAMP domain-containing protein [Nanoarchaeota archaeon]
MLLISTYLLYSQFKIIEEYDAVIDNMVLEKKISQVLPDLLIDYNDLIKNIDNPLKSQKYNSDKEHIEEIFRILDGRIVNPESKIAYRGLKNIARDIIMGCDKAINDSRNGDISTYSYYYNEGSRKLYYVDMNTAQLLAYEVGFAETTQKKIQDSNRISTSIGIGIILLITFTCILFSFTFSKNVTNPLEHLLIAVEDVKRGNFSTRVEIKDTGEVEKLGSAFNEMILAISSSQSELNKERDNLSLSNIELEKKIAELEKIQKLVVDRELKMIELKRKIKEIGGKSPK